jgi:acetyltransferase-like isoleucine patch superfamily enzyme
MNLDPWKSQPDATTLDRGGGMAISPLACVETMKIGNNVSIGPFAVVGPDVRLGDDVVIHPHVVLEGVVEIGDDVVVLPGAHVGRLPTPTAAVSRKPGRSGPVVIGAGSSIGSHAVVYTNVSIGDQTLIGDGVSVREGNRIGSGCWIGRCVTINYDSVIGDGSRILDLTAITGNCRIGSDVFISCLVSTVNDNAFGRVGYDEGAIVGPTVEDGASVGAGAVLLPAVVIGSHAIVGAGAVVTRDVRPGVTVMGIPAREVLRGDRR